MPHRVERLTVHHVTQCVVGFGCPRAGTTFLRTAIERMTGLLAFKMNEHSALHPCNSRTGLLDLAKTLHQKRFAYVRIKRHPREIVESFLYARHPDAEPHLRGIARNTDERIVEWIVSESEAVAAQRGATIPGTHRRLAMVEVRYEDLGDRLYRVDVGARLKYTGAVDTRQASEFVAGLDRFGKRAARHGRLAGGVAGESFMSTAEDAWFGDRLAAVCEREGYTWR